MSQRNAARQLALVLFIQGPGPTATQVAVGGNLREKAHNPQCRTRLSRHEFNLSSSIEHSTRMLHRNGSMQLDLVLFFYN